MLDTEKLLKLIAEDAKLTNAQLAAMLGAREEEVASAVASLEKDGIIKGYKALIDWDKAGADRVQAIIELRVSPRRESGFDEIAETIANFEEVDSVMLMSGKSFQDIALFVAKRLSPLDDVLSTATHFVLRTYKKDGVLYGLEPTDERELL